MDQSAKEERKEKREEKKSGNLPSPLMVIYLTKDY